MTYKIEHLYPTPIYRSVVDNYKNINEKIDTFINDVEFCTPSGWGSTLFLTPLEGNVLKKYGLKKLSNEIDRHLSQYCKELKFSKRRYKIDAWFSRFEYGNYAHIHNHGYADISGVYYYRSNLNDGNLFFVSPNPYLDGSSMCFSRGRANYESTPGSIMMFPGWLKHGVYTNTTDNTRISISFNIEFDRSGGIVK